MNSKRSISLILVFATIALVYFLFPSKNPTADSFSYAADIKYDLALFRPHHLLYSPFVKLLATPLVKIFNGDLLEATQRLNSIFSLANLWLLFVILKQLKVHWRLSILMVLMVAFSFGVWRFSVENEPYIIALSFSLIGFLFAIKSLHNKHFVFFSGLFCVLAILFHQIQFLWWLGLLVAYIFYYRSWKKFFFFVVSALLIPIAYLLVVKFVNHQEVTVSNIFNYALHYYVDDQDKIGFSWRYFLFFGVGVVRTFLQVYPTILLLLQKNIAFYLPLLFLLLWIVFTLKNWKRLKTKYPLRRFLFVEIASIIIISLLLFFSLMSMGNAEFLIGLPFLLVIFLSSKYYFWERWIAASVLLFFVWNFTYGILPNYLYRFHNASEIVSFHSHKPNSYFLSKDNILQEVNAYQKGELYNEKLLNAFSVEVSKIDSLLKNQNIIYTNAVNDRYNITRGDYLNNELLLILPKKYRLTPVDSFSNFYGKEVIYQLQSY